MFLLNKSDKILCNVIRLLIFFIDDLSFRSEEGGWGVCMGRGSKMFFINDLSFRS
jgi:hypothetical protein